MNKHYSLIALMLAVGVGVALAQVGQQPGQPGQPGVEQPGQPDRPGMPPDRPGVERERINEEEFIKMAISANQFEVQLSEFVTERAQDPQIRQFAQRMVQDHRQAKQRLQQIAQQMDRPVSEELLPMHRAKLEQYRQKQGRDLELSYIFGQVGNHYTEVLWYQYLSQHAQNPQLRQFASQTLPQLHQHLRQAQQIAPGGEEARLAGERIDPDDREREPRPDMPREPGMPGQPGQQPGQPGEPR